MNTGKLARDHPAGDKPEGISDADWKLFQARRRSERAQVDVDERRLKPTEKLQFTSKVLERSGKKHLSLALEEATD